MARKRKPFIAGGGCMLAPGDDVGSSIRYYIEVEQESASSHPFLSTRITLTDCDEKVVWGGYGSRGIAHQRKKIKKAIRVLEETLRKLDQAEAVYCKVKSEWDKQNKGQGQGQKESGRCRAGSTITVDPSQIVEVR